MLHHPPEDVSVAKLHSMALASLVQRSPGRSLEIEFRDIDRLGKKVILLATETPNSVIFTLQGDS
jgi:hypothetical protein